MRTGEKEEEEEGLDLSLEMVLVLEDGIEVGVHADTVGEHLLLVVQVRVRAEVVGEVDVLVHNGAGTGPARRWLARSVRRTPHHDSSDVEEATTAAGARANGTGGLPPF